MRYDVSKYASIRDCCVLATSEAAAGCEVLPTVAGRCVETSKRIQASHLAATSCRKAVPASGLLLFEVALRNLCASSRYRIALEIPVAVPVLRHCFFNSEVVMGAVI